jgi:NTE family protein
MRGIGVRMATIANPNIRRAFNMAYSAANLEAPVAKIATDPGADQPRAGIALCLSGGGYRAMLFHVGVLWRLNELGYLSKIARFSSVSGGSITAAVLGVGWGQLAFDGSGIATNFRDAVVGAVRSMASHTVDEWSILKGIFSPGSIADKVAGAYRKHLFGDATLQSLPDSPRFVFNATNIQSKALCRFSKPYMWDYRVGKVANPTLDIAVAVAASSAFPPVLSPLTLEFKETDFVPNTGLDLQFPPYTTKMVLTDGGVYDNLGLETAWKNYQTVLVSDAGGMYAPEPNPKHDWIGHTKRVTDLIDNQVRSLRKRQVIDSFKARARTGAYWGIWTEIGDYQLPDALPAPPDKTHILATTETRLKALDAELQEKLINWGYAVCDAAMRKHVNAAPELPRPVFPYPVGVG